MSKKNAFTPLEIRNSNGVSSVRNQRPYGVSKRFLTGFTLVELLVVIAIIALLMSILMPALGRVRKQAKTVICKSNLRQWGIMFTMYANDNDNYLMANWMGGDKTESHHYWMEALRPYYSNAGGIRLCPRASKPCTEAGGGEFGTLGPFYAWGIMSGKLGQPSSYFPPVIAGDYGSYGCNGWISNPLPEVFPDFEDNFWRTMLVKGAGDIPMFCGDQWLAGFPGPENEPAEYELQPWGGSSNMVRLGPNRHDGYVNQVFLDSSVHKVGLKQLWTLKWHRSYDREGPWTQAGGVTRGNWPAWMRDFKDY